MHLDDAHFDEPKQAGQIIDPQPDTAGTIALFDFELVHFGWNRRQRPPVIIDSAILVGADDIQEPFSDMLQRMVGNGAPVFFEQGLARNRYLAKARRVFCQRPVNGLAHLISGEVSHRLACSMISQDAAS
jgi:hypothetical protein